MLRNQIIPLALLLGFCSSEYKYEPWDPSKLTLPKLYEKYSDLKPVKEKNLCKSIRHSSEAEYFCCGGNMYKYGISFDNARDTASCFKTPLADEEPINVTMWNFYTCQIMKKMNEPDAKASEFAAAMLGDLKDPYNYSKTIISRAAAVSLPKDYHRRQAAIRYTYHTIEKNVCEKQESTVDLDSNFDTCTDGMDYYRENIHSRGDCCKGYAIPVRLEYLRRAPTLAVRKCTKSLMYQIPEKPIFYMDYDFEESDAQQMCTTACVLKQLNLLTQDNIKPEMLWNANKDAEFWYSPFNFDFKTVSDKLIGLFSKGIQQQFRDEFNETVAYYEHPENYTINMREEIYDLVGHIQESEFWENVTRGEIEPTILNCQGYNDVVQKIEMALYKFCSN